MKLSGSRYSGMQRRKWFLFVFAFVSLAFLGKDKQDNLLVTVKDKTGKEVANATLVLCDETGERSYAIYDKTKKCYRFSGATPSHGILTITHSDYETKGSEWFNSAPESLDFVLDKKGLARFRVGRMDYGSRVEGAKTVMCRTYPHYIDIVLREGADGDAFGRLLDSLKLQQSFIRELGIYLYHRKDTSGFERYDCSEVKALAGNVNVSAVYFPVKIEHYEYDIAKENPYSGQMKDTTFRGKLLFLSQACSVESSAEGITGNNGFLTDSIARQFGLIRSNSFSKDCLFTHEHYRCQVQTDAGTTLGVLDILECVDKFPFSRSEPVFKITIN